MTGMFSVDFISALEKIDINTAPLEDLIKIIHIGEVRAKELIFLRPFSSLDELTKIKGISERRLKDIKKQGLAWVKTNQSQPKPQLTTEPEPKTEKPKPITYPFDIVINEILPSPEGPDAKEEWVEIFNQNSFEVSLSDWQLKDKIGSTSTFTFSKETEISAKGFLVFFRPTTKITLNNDGDEISLLQPDGKIINRVEFEKAPRGQSYNRTETGWLWSTVLTPEATNIISAPPSTKEIESPKEEVQEISFQKEAEENLSKKGLAAIGEQISSPSKSLYVFLIALSLAFLSGVIILILKKRLKKVDFKEKLE